MALILFLLGAVAVLTIAWCAVPARRELHRRAARVPTAPNPPSTGADGPVSPPAAPVLPSVKATGASWRG
ncbi:hypothetical protein [Saccharothrix texasensis]|uniref:Uncharacterized protein n=1 Tax=Saccharothrix texasensis TaxID=103734 RepID=A0A3N1HE01_9PSEU|nr:hypothetical protein [Saccharothrix texasensis]ROP40716.1 hypothetical protein EDD40_6133 [Saccharothrix texasensis]